MQVESTKLLGNNAAHCSEAHVMGLAVSGSSLTFQTSPVHGRASDPVSRDPQIRAIPKLFQVMPQAYVMLMAG
jgi:hypothetical protein